MNRPCAHCGGSLEKEEGIRHRYDESGVPGIVLHGVTGWRCPGCGEEEIELPHLDGIHHAIAGALVRSPRRLSGAQFRFLRKYSDLTGEELGRHLKTDKTKISKWERGEDPIGVRTDFLMRMVVTALSPDLAPEGPLVARHLPTISEESGEDLEIHVDARALTYAHRLVSAA